jgi:hypothetical protein
MEEQKDTYPGSDNEEEALAYLRKRAESAETEAPRGEKRSWAPKEMSGQLRAWVVRAIIVVLCLILIGDVWYFAQLEQEEPDLAGAPTPVVMAAPVVESVPTPTIQTGPESAVEAPPDLEEEVVYPPPPTPTEPELPDDFQGVELPPPPRE